LLLPLLLHYAPGRPLAFPGARKGDRRRPHSRFGLQRANQDPATRRLLLNRNRLPFPDLRRRPPPLVHCPPSGLPAGTRGWSVLYLRSK
jgi:hypothetical protein